MPRADLWLSQEVSKIHFGGKAEVSFLIYDGSECRRVWVAIQSDRSTLVTHSLAELPVSVTVRQLEVLTGIACGMTNPVIAAHLQVAPKTVSKHVEHLLHAFNCGSRVELAVTAVRRQLIVLTRRDHRPEFNEIVRKALIDEDLPLTHVRRSTERPIICRAIYPAGDTAGNVLAMQQGARLAVDHLNALGGIGGRMIQFGCIETNEPVGEVERALSVGADALLLGNFSVTPALAALRAVRSSGVPVLHSMIAPQLSEEVQSTFGLDNVYQVCGVESAYSRSFAESLSTLLRRNQDERRSVSLVLRPHMLTDRAVNDVEQSMHASGLRIHELLSSTDLENDPTTVQRLMLGNPAAVHLPVLTAPTLQRILPLLPREQIATFVDFSPSSPTFLKTMGDSADGIYWSTIIGSGQDRRHRKFRAAYAERYRRDPGVSIAAVHFDMVRLLAAAWRENHKPWDHPAVRRFLANEVYYGVTGPYWLGGPGQRGLTQSVDEIDDALAHPIRKYQVRGGSHHLWN